MTRRARGWLTAWGILIAAALCWVVLVVVVFMLFAGLR